MKNERKFKETEIWFFENINKLDKYFSQTVQEKEEKICYQYRDEKALNAIQPTGLKREAYQQHYTKNVKTQMTLTNLPKDANYQILLKNKQIT